MAYYDPTLGVWSQKRQLTTNDAAERFISGAFSSDGNLFCAYDRNQTVYQDRQELVNGQWVTVQGVPSGGQSDLYYLVYQMGVDLAVAVEDVNVDPPNPAPGTQATITATVRNLGEAPAADAEVAFYDGDPGAGGTLIDSAQTISGALAGGEKAEVVVSWTVPDDGQPHQIVTVVDPFLAKRIVTGRITWLSFWALSPDVNDQFHPDPGGGFQPDHHPSGGQHGGAASLRCFRWPYGKQI